MQAGLFGAVAHEVNSACHTVIGMATTRVDVGSERDRRALGAITAATHRVVALVEGLALLNDDGTALVTQGTRVATVMSEVLETCKGDAMSRGIALDADLSDTTLVVCSDRIARGVLDLLMLSVLRGPERGSTLTVSVRRDERGCVVEIGGCAVRDGDAAWLLLESLCSRYNLGLFFHAGSPTVVVAFACVAEGAARIRMLHVDEDETSRELIQLLLGTESGVDVASAAAADEALALASVWHPNVVVVDQHLHESKGVDLLRKLRGTAEHEATPMVVLTGDPDRAVDTAAREVGAHVLRKPLDAASLLAVIRAQVVSR